MSAPMTQKQIEAVEEAKIELEESRSYLDKLMILGFIGETLGLYNLFGTGVTALVVGVELILLSLYTSYVVRSGDVVSVGKNLNSR